MENKMNNAKRIITCLLCLALIFSLAACGTSAPGSSSPSSSASGSQTEPDVSADPTPDDQPDISFPEGCYASYFFVSITVDGVRRAVTASDDELGGAYVEYIDDVKKVGTFPSSVLEEIVSELAASGLASFNGKSEYSEGSEDYASMYIELSDGSYLTADYTGAVADEFIAAYNRISDYFKTLTADLDEYVPQAQVSGELDSDVLAALQEIINNSGIDGLDSMCINSIELDEYFDYNSGLSSSNGISAAGSCGAMMSTTPYSLVIVKLDDVNNVQAVRSDFENNLNWRKWVCVNPTNALIAEKDNMVLCLMGADEMYTLTASSVEAAGWNNLSSFDNPEI